MKTTIFYIHNLKWTTWKKGSIEKPLKHQKTKCTNYLSLHLKNPSPCITTFQGVQPFHLPLGSSKITHTHIKQGRENSIT